MLEEYKKLYQQSADTLQNWKKVPILDLANKYIELKSAQKPCDNYFAAIVLRYWKVLDQLYRKDTYFVQQEDCYNWLIDAILYVLNNHVWTDPQSSLYGDSKAAEKAIAICIAGQRTKFYRYIKHDIRNANYTKISLEQLCGQEEESTYDWALPLYYDEDNFCYDLFDIKIKEYFNNKDYFNAFVLYCILYFDMFVNRNNKGNVLSNRKLKQKFRNLDSSYCLSFSNKYKIKYEEVKNATKYVSNITDDRFNRNMKHLKNDLLKDFNVRCALNL